MFDSARLQDSFCLKKPFEGFSPNSDSGISPTRTSSLLMATHLAEEEKMIEHANMRMFSSMMPKFFIKGEYGSGKTHLANRIASVLTDKFRDGSEFELEVKRIEIGEVTSKTNFTYLFNKMMEAAFKQNSVEEALANLKIKKAEQKLPAIYSDQDYANDLDAIFGKVSPSNAALDAILKMTQHAIQPNLSSEGYNELYKGTSGLTHSDERVRLLDSLAILFKEAKSRMFLFIVDQANMLSDITNQDAKMSWRAAAIEQAEDSNSAFGWIYVTGTDAETPGWFNDSQVLTRLGGADDFENPAITNIQGVADLEALELFFTQLFATVVDSELLQERISSEEEGWREEDFLGEDFNEAQYPFTEQAMTRYIDTFSARSDPVRTHLQRLHRMAVYAVMRGRKIILDEDVAMLQDF